MVYRIYEVFPSNAIVSYLIIAGSERFAKECARSYLGLNLSTERTRTVLEEDLTEAQRKMATAWMRGKEGRVPTGGLEDLFCIGVGRKTIKTAA